MTSIRMADSSHEDKRCVHETSRRIKGFTIYYYGESPRRKRRKKWPQLAYNAFKGPRKVRNTRVSFSMLAPFYDIPVWWPLFYEGVYCKIEQDRSRLGNWDEG